MPNEKSAVNEFLKEATEEKSPFAPEEKPLFDEAAEDDKTEEEVKDEKPLPFHKDPKVQRYVEKQIAKALESVKPSEAEKFKDEVKGEDEITDVLVRIIGNDTPEKVSAVKDFRKVLGSLEERGAKKALAELTQQSAEQTAQDRKAVDDLKRGFEDIEEEFGVDLTSGSSKAEKLDSDFRAYIRRIAPKNEDGEVIGFPDLTAAFEEFQEKSKRAPTNTRAKELAARGMSRSSDATVQPKGGNTWKDVEKMLGKLG